MSRSRRNFSAEFKTNLVLQLLKGEKELNVLAVENDIQPNLLRNWSTRLVLNSALKFLLDLDTISTFFHLLAIVYQIH